MSLDQPLERMKIECFSFSHLSLSLFFFLFGCDVHTACGRLAPGLRIKPGAPAVRALSLNYGTAREVPESSTSNPSVCKKNM